MQEQEKIPGTVTIPGILMAAGEGFEPSHTESESAVLPLHKPAMKFRSLRSEQILLYRKDFVCQAFFCFSLEVFSGGRGGPAPADVHPVSLAPQAVQKAPDEAAPAAGYQRTAAGICGTARRLRPARDGRSARPDGGGEKTS